jgi:glycosyltransferase involved in cell wall biosynthesis
MQVILGRSAAETPPLVSIFTRLHDTGARLWDAYRSLASQGHDNWEWVLVDDPRWGATTLATARQIARRDPRVHIYDLSPKSGGNVGEAKYRGAVLCRGDYLLELGDRDELTPWALELLVEAFRQFPEAGFAYSDWACIDDAMPPVTAGSSVALGYGSYYLEVHRGIPLTVARPPAPNPKTLRHAAAMPQGFCAWRRDVYHAIGGHNRRLAIAVDYELMLRTFLATVMVHVPKLCYLHHRSGDADARPAADSAGSVRSISRFYDGRIRSRFAQLGLTDWAAEASPADPLAAPSRFGAEEQSAALTMALPRRAPFAPP